MIFFINSWIGMKTSKLFKFPKEAEYDTLQNSHSEKEIMIVIKI